MKDGHVFVLRTCNADMSSNYDPKFIWPVSGPVEAEDWSPDRACGQGLHGLLWGDGNYRLLDYRSEARWLVVEVPNNDELVHLGDKVKFRRGEVVYCGDQKGATSFIGQVWGVGVFGQKLTVGRLGHAEVGHYGIAVSGDSGISESGDGGVSVSGDGGWSKAGIGGVVSSGHRGRLCLQGKDGRKWIRLVGGGIRPGRFYRVNDAGCFVETQKPAEDRPAYWHGWMT